MTTIAVMALGCTSSDSARPVVAGNAGAGGADAGAGGSGATAGGGLGGGAAATGGAIAGGTGGAVAGGTGGAVAGGAAGGDAGGACGVLSTEYGTGGSYGGFAGNPGACPASPSPMNDPCPCEGLICHYPGSDGCALYDRCLGGRWAVNYKSNGFCNPPPVCPPSDPVPGATCNITPGGGAHCRYPHGACFAYLACDVTFHFWSTPAYVYADSCCPAISPPMGASCPDGAACTYPDAVATCVGGAWHLGPALKGIAGMGGAAGASGAAGAGG